MADTESELDLYKVLGVPEHASTNEIKTAYRAKVKVSHPDIGGDPREFRNINLAYETLSDPRRKRMYDLYGLEGVCQSSTASYTQGSVLGSSGNPMGGMDNNRRDRRDHPRNDFPHFQEEQSRKRRFSADLKVTLKEIYLGTTKRVRVRHKVDCEACKNADNNIEQECSMCLGQGEVVRITQSSPGRVVQQRLKCEKCNARGTYLTRTNCFVCHGTRKVSQKRTLEVEVESGMVHGQEILPKEDVGFVLVLNVRKHHEMKLIGKDLVVFRKISLTECLAGCTVTIEHLDGRKLAITSPTSDIIRPNYAYKIPGEGMPHFRNGNKKGDMYIRFSIIFPTEPFRPEVTSLLQAILSSTSSGYTDGPASPNARALVGLSEEEKKVLFNSREERKDLKIIRQGYDLPDKEESSPGGERTKKVPPPIPPASSQNFMGANTIQSSKSFMQRQRPV